MIIKNSVLVMKYKIGASQPDHYVVFLKSAGFDVKVVNVLRFRYCNSKQLKKKLENASKYEGIVFANPLSVKSVRLVTDCLAEPDELLRPWRSKAIFGVGESTCSAASQMLGLDCLGRECEEAEELCQKMVNSSTTYEKPFLFPHANLRSETLHLYLPRYNMKLDPIFVIATDANPFFEENVIEATNYYKSISEYILFFRFSIHSITQRMREIPGFNEAKLIPINKAEEIALKERGFTVFGVPQDETPQAVLNLIFDINKEM